MTTAFVRLQSADLALIAGRLNTLLTPEGARAWYAHDVAELLQEVTARGQELEEAREALIADGVTDTGASLPEMLTEWKATASGIYEKAQYKKLRAELADIRLEKAEQSEVIRNMAERARQIAEERERQRTEWASKEQALEHAVADATENLEALRHRMGELQGEMARADQARRDADRRAEDEAMSKALAVEDVKKNAREALQAIIESTLS